jgi:hypothetical protein
MAIQRPSQREPHPNDSIASCARSARRCCVHAIGARIALLVRFDAMLAAIDLAAFAEAVSSARQ